MQLVHQAQHHLVKVAHLVIKERLDLALALVSMVTTITTQMLFAWVKSPFYLKLVPIPVQLAHQD